MTLFGSTDHVSGNEGYGLSQEDIFGEQAPGTPQAPTQAAPAIDQGQPAQPEQPIQQPAQQPIEQPTGQEQPQPQVSAPAEQPTQQGQPQEGYGKFKSLDDLKQGLENIGKTLGKTPNWPELDTPQKILRAYEQAEKEIGITSNVNDYLSLNEERQRAKQLEQQNQMLQNYIQQIYYQDQLQRSQMQFQPQPMMQQPQELRQPATQPYTNQYSQWPPPVTQQTQATEQPGQSVQQEQITISDEDLAEMFTDSKKAQEILGKVARSEAERISEQKIQALEQKRQQEEQARQSQMQQRQAELRQKRALDRYYDTQVKQLQQTYGDDFEAHRKGAGQILQQKPWYASMPGGFEMAYQEAKTLGLKDPNYQPKQQPQQIQTQQAAQPNLHVIQGQGQQHPQTQQYQQPPNLQAAPDQQQAYNQQQMFQAQKQAARMPQGGGPLGVGRQKTQDEIELDMIFGENPGQKGIFDS